MENRENRELRETSPLIIGSSPIGGATKLSAMCVWFVCFLNVAVSVHY